MKSSLSTTTRSNASKWSFARKARLGLIVVFVSFLIFFVACLTIGIVSNLHWHYAELQLPTETQHPSPKLSSLKLKTCLKSLEVMYAELVEQVEKSFWGNAGRDQQLEKWKTWSNDWNKRFEKLGMQCALTNLKTRQKPKTVILLTGIYQHIEYFHKRHSRLVRRYVTENAEALTQLHSLFQRAEQEIESLEGKPIGKEES